MFHGFTCAGANALKLLVGKQIWTSRMKYTGNIPVALVDTVESN